MGSKPFSDPDIRRRLLASATAGAPKDAPAYIGFFTTQAPIFSTAYGYGRVLRSEYELSIVNLFLTEPEERLDFREMADILVDLARERPAEHATTFAPLRQAVEVFISYRQHAVALETMAHGGTLLHAELTIAAEVAATGTAWAFRDLALHELYVMAGGSLRASEQALMTGESFANLRKRYRVKLAAATFELPAWRSGLLKTMQELQASVKPAYASFADMRQQMQVRGRVR